jgi:hypothetical protein
MQNNQLQRSKDLRGNRHSLIIISRTLHHHNNSYSTYTQCRQRSHQYLYQTKILRPLQQQNRQITNNHQGNTSTKRALCLVIIGRIDKRW